MDKIKDTLQSAKDYIGAENIKLIVVIGLLTATVGLINKALK